MGTERAKGWDNDMKRGEKDPIDAYAGQRMRMRRGLLGWSQDKLAQAIGVSFQQVQKYENGTNRMGASRLMNVAQVLGVPVAYFFDGFQEGGSPMPMVAEEASTLDDTIFEKKETLDLLKAYYALPEAARKHVIGMLKGMKEE